MTAKPYMLTRDLFDPFRYGLYDSATGAYLATIFRTRSMIDPARVRTMGTVPGLPTIEQHIGELQSEFADRLYRYAQPIAAPAESLTDQESLFT